MNSLRAYAHAMAVFGLLLWACCTPERAAAEENRRAVVIPVIVGDEPAPGEPLFERAAVAREASGGEALSTKDTTRLTRNQTTREPRELMPEELETWFRHQQRAQKQLMRYRYKDAAASLREVQNVSHQAIEALNREAATARTVLDTCLYLVRSLWEVGHHDQAESQARQCRQLVPSIQPTGSLHTPAVREVLHRVDEARRREAAAELRVETSEDGCLVRVNGLALGETPLTVRELIPGKYRVQVECTDDAPGRVYRVDVSGRHELYADPGLEDALRVSPAPHLYYRSRGVMEANLREDARALARSFGVAGALVVDQDKLLRYDRNDDKIAEAVATQVDDVRRLTVGLLGFGPPDRRADRPAGAARRTAGLTFSVLGGAVVATSLGLYGRRVRLGNQVDSADTAAEQQQALEEWEGARAGVLVAGPIGAAVAASGFSLAYRPRPKAPWWTWAGGAAGLATLTAGIVSVAAADRCPSSVQLTPECIPGQRAVDRGVVLMSIGAPFVFMPVWAVAKRTEISVQAQGAALVVKGRF